MDPDPWQDENSVRRDDTLARVEAMKRRYEYRAASRRNKATWELIDWRLAAMDRAQSGEMNLTLAGRMEVGLVPDEPGRAPTSLTQQTISPSAERTRPPAAAATPCPDAGVDETNLTASVKTSNDGRNAGSAKRTRRCWRSPSSHTTKRSAEEARAVQATTQGIGASTQSYQCRAEGRLAKRTRAIPLGRRVGRPALGGAQSFLQLEPEPPYRRCIGRMPHRWSVAWRIRSCAPARQHPLRLLH